MLSYDYEVYYWIGVCPNILKSKQVYWNADETNCKKSRSVHKLVAENYDFYYSW